MSDGGVTAQHRQKKAERILRASGESCRAPTGLITVEKVALRLSIATEYLDENDCKATITYNSVVEQPSRRVEQLEVPQQCEFASPVVRAVQWPVEIDMGWMLFESFYGRSPILQLPKVSISLQLDFKNWDPSSRSNHQNNKPSVGTVQSIKQRKLPAEMDSEDQDPVGTGRWFSAMQTLPPPFPRVIPPFLEHELPHGSSRTSKDLEHLSSTDPRHHRHLPKMLGESLVKGSDLQTAERSLAELHTIGGELRRD
ncbi:unnamed protein product [Taenia asiatica]|uniref:Uncharacterized protein n=1 Tax=Taenia asiatica TaxID=60517 RepID=A0A0R3W6S5_TAEAS|nr:unnamed protein product [Taenia asiatica]